MSESQENSNLSFRLFKGMQENNLEYTYRGNFTETITDTILALAETNLTNAETQKKIKKKVYFIMVEGLQNITRHQSEKSEEFDKHPALFVVQRKKDGYFITTGNLIENENVDFLRNLIEKVNSMDRAGLKEYARKVLNEGHISDKGGAGLGLIEIAKKSGQKLDYEFKKINDKYSFFYMHNKIPYDDEDTEIEAPKETSLGAIIRLHHLLEIDNILLNISGNFTQETLIHLLQIIEKQLQGTVILKMRVFNLMVEMLQNVVKHADNYVHNNVEGKHAIFYISENEEQIKFTTGNYINNERIKDFEGMLKRINTLEGKDLSDYYNESLLNFDQDSDISCGLGLIDIKMKCKNSLIYDFYQIDDKVSFFTLQLLINKIKAKMTPFTATKTKDTPEVILDADKGVFSIMGRSFPENAITFYKPVLKWISQYVLTANSTTEIKFKYEYYNTASAKQIAKIFVMLERLSHKSNLIVKWHYQSEDYEMMEEGMRYEQLTDINIETVEDK